MPLTVTDAAGPQRAPPGRRAEVRAALSVVLLRAGRGCGAPPPEEPRARCTTGRLSPAPARPRLGAPGGLADHAVFFRKMTKLILSEIAQARYSSLLNDFVESNFFVTDGDSLLVTFLCEKSFNRDSSFFYLVECYLADFMRNEGQFA
ncbi:LOW QUALITY PROTEIN: probable ATP-dependent RNA helicase DDX60-like [Cervus canadensis]|uniref:LOW QUALITY PROTEIN: probable ATP-dependent RNA helicase DDX60-like n=1 Tax=Cervus canadensis TaxID=1574408 RepID=UPI001C9E4E14|nr:LOW QUALITY PROTEIN: probable ATP-dependent RNA helicase DDX60-like [Cervus canadensis]